MAANQSTSSESIEGLQYLRGVAALMVVFFHSRSYFSSYPEWTHLGARGVDIFFVISGFIMAYTTRNISADTSPIQASLSFLSKRVIRVVPMYWLALLWTSSAYWLHWIASSHSLGDLSTNLSSDMIEIFKDFAFIPHFSIDEDEQGEVFPILIQGWTLNYEMFFYALFALCLLHRQTRLISASLILMTLFATGRFISSKEVFTVFYTSASLVEFVIGIIVFEIYMKTRHMEFGRYGAIVFCVFGFLVLNDGSHVNNKLVMGVGAALIVWSFIQVFRDVRVKALKVLGDASYSIYLFHATAFGGVRAIIKDVGLGSSGFFNAFIIIMSQVIVGVIIGIAIYYLVEKPLLKSLRNLYARAFAIGRARAAKTA